jgi:tetratricopeptide (TPR) repeat protein
MRALGLAGLVLLLSAPAAWAQSPLVAEVRVWAARYHEDPARIDRLRAELARALETDSHVDNLIALAQVCFIWGDVRARTTEEKLEAYEQGRQAARRAVELAPRNPLAHFWYGTNTGRWGQTKGVVRSLFLLPTVKQEIEAVLELDPKFPAVYSLAGNVYYEVPGLLGGDLDKAEQMFRKGLELDPRFTGMRVGLARVLVKKGRIPEARRELEAVLEEKAPSNLADWTVKDSPRAREILESLKGKP